MLKAITLYEPYASLMAIGAPHPPLPLKESGEEVFDPPDGTQITHAAMDLELPNLSVRPS